MRAIPDLMLCLQELNEGTVRRIRKTAEDPPRVSVIDTISVITGHSPTVCSHTLQRIKEAYPEVGQDLSNFRFAGRGQRDTPVVDSRVSSRVSWLSLAGWLRECARQLPM